MKIYLASKFALKDKVIELANYLFKKNGAQITCEWWFDNIKGIPGTDEEWYINPSVINIRDRDFNGIDDADAVVLVSSNDTPLSFNGANLELGYAIAKRKKVFILGKVDRNALYCGVTFCKTATHLSMELRNIDKGEVIH